MSAGDAANKVSGPRLIAAGADLIKCHVLDLAENTQEAVKWIEQELDELPTRSAQTRWLLSIR